MATNFNLNAILKYIIYYNRAVALKGGRGGRERGVGFEWEGGYSSKGKGGKAVREGEKAEWGRG